MEKKKHILLFLSSAFYFLSINGFLASAEGTLDGSEQWGYVEVRPKAHIFWWLYRSPYRVEDPAKPWPIILWLQGGPGSSGIGLGNFLEIGPLDINLNPRNSTWLHKADLLFVDSPVGTGFSYVEDNSLLVRSDEEAATDLTALLKELFNGDEKLQKSPLYIFAESYGGKFAVTLGISALQAIVTGELKLQIGGIALGDSWISPEDFVFTWGPLLKDLSRINHIGLNISNSLALKIKQQIGEGDYEGAEKTWNDLENVILQYSNNVDFYNFMFDYEHDPVVGSSTEEGKGIFSDRSLAYLLNSKHYSTAGIRVNSLINSVYELMNGPIKKKLEIIPENVTWGGQRALVFHALVGGFMKPRIKEVDDLLAQGIRVTIYNGQVDLICSTKGAEAWVNKLKWEGLKNFTSQDRSPLYCKNDNTTTKGFMSSYNNLAFYWILGAGHFVPVDQPCISLQMVGNITRSPNDS